MNIGITSEGSKTTIALEGRLDTVTSPELESKLLPVLPATKELVYDLSKLEYISSAGLRVLLSSQKAINKAAGKMVVTNVNNEVMEIFEVTGFSDILTFE